MKELKAYIEEAGKCVLCGTCKSVCPVFDVKRRESLSPRGRVALIEARLKGEEGFGESYNKSIKDCTLCSACVETCPKGVDVPTLVLAARADYAEKEGMGLSASFAVKNILNSEKLMPWVLKIASKFQGLLLKSTEGGFVGRFALPLIGNNRLIPELPDVFFLERPHIRELSSGGMMPSGSAKRKTTALRVGFYVGCGINYILPEIGEATVRVLKGLKAEVVVPQAQVCCGMPALSSGLRETARELALKNIEAFESLDVDYIVTSCATCGHGLKNVFKELLGGSPEIKKRVEAFTSKVRDITELLERELRYKGVAVRSETVEGIMPLREGIMPTVTYHDPCHLKKYQGISEEPRSLLEKTGLTFKDMKNPCKCCGLGGGLAVTDYELSIEIARKKAESIRESRAGIVATACPGCIIQLKDACHRYGVDAKVVHVVELLN